jgi:hypothetical protein
VLVKPLVAALIFESIAVAVDDELPTSVAVAASSPDAAKAASAFPKEVWTLVASFVSAIVPSTIVELATVPSTSVPVAVKDTDKKSLRIVPHVPLSPLTVGSRDMPYICFTLSLIHPVL